MQCFKVAFFVESVAQKSQNIVVTHPYTLHFSSQFFKIFVTHPYTPHFSSQFFKIFVTHPISINELDTVVTPTPVLWPWHPQNLERALMTLKLMLWLVKLMLILLLFPHSLGFWKFRMFISFNYYPLFMIVIIN